MPPTEANDGELFVQSRGGVFPEEQKNAHDLPAHLTAGQRGQWREAEGLVFFHLKAQSIDSTDFVLDRDACSEENGGTK